MNRYLPPRNDHARLMALERITLKGTQDRQEGVMYLFPDTLGQISALTPQFAAAFHAHQSRDSVRMAAVETANDAIDAVIKKVRAIWVTVKQRTKPGGLPLSVRLYYGLPANGKNPYMRNATEWLILADNIIKGEAGAVAAGYPPLLEPTVASLQTLLAAAQTAVSQREAAKTACDKAAATLGNLRQQADELIEDAVSDMRYTLRKQTAAHRREIMRSYGACFSQNTAEGEAGDTAAAALL